MDRMTCAARSAMYRSSEPIKLYLARRKHRVSFPTYTDHPLVSVLIPTYNRKDLLIERALSTVALQSYDNLHLIIACHGCTDGTEYDIDRWYFGKRPRMSFPIKRLTVISVPRVRTYPPTAVNHWLAGPVAPLNAGLRVVKGDWIARIDDDDVWSTDHIDVSLRAAYAEDSEFISSCVLRGDEEGVFVRTKPYELPGGMPIGGTQTWVYRSYLRFFRYNPDCWRKSWNRVNDTDLQDRMWCAGVRMSYLDYDSAIIWPRDGDRNIGLAAYTADRAKYEEKYAFKQ